MKTYSSLYYIGDSSIWFDKDLWDFKVENQTDPAVFDPILHFRCRNLMLEEDISVCLFENDNLIAVFEKDSIYNKEHKSTLEQNEPPVIYYSMKCVWHD